MKQVISNFIPSTEVMNVDGVEHEFTASDVHTLIGLTCSDIAVPLSGSMAEVDGSVLHHFNGKQINLVPLEKNLLGRAIIEYGFRALLVAYLVGTFLCPGTSSYIGKEYLYAMCDIQWIGSYDWASQVLDHLCESVRGFK
ncbi:hypothetical protein MLD38_010095 [Melastoma candidum]|uniref:Uncharacterized protein n=1 Tax=Melastoma candidum TaxID=119954 RepID=A0ACB9R0J6_9MYRT|nr:hypothetical protein MLD38_010095 [Melastoma candidum]